MNWWKKWQKARKINEDDINATIERIQEARKKVKPGTAEFRALSEDYEQELKNKKLVKEMKHMGIPGDKILFAVVILMVAGFGFALDLDSPKALKIAQFTLGLVKKA